ncbi:MAG: hypothetical protein GY842_03965 [bacterium]|nr:hypothetical protein [bacterium]
MAQSCLPSGYAGVKACHSSTVVGGATSRSRHPPGGDATSGIYSTIGSPGETICG